MTAAIEPRGPLAGVRVVDLTSNMSGPYGTMILGDQGADVIKVEAPGGDVIRRLGPGAEDLSAYFANLNRSKRSVVVDLTTDEGRGVIARLLDTADVLVHNLRPGVAEQLGLDAGAVTAGRPALIHVEISGYGDVGPFAGRPAYDHAVQAMSGVAARQADRDGTPKLVRQGLIDKATGQAVAQAVAAALYERTRTGRGRQLRVSMLDVALAFLWPDGMMEHTVADPAVVRPSIDGSFRLSPTADGHVAMIAVTPDQFRRLAAAVAEVGPPARPEGDLRALLRRMGEVLAGLTTEAAVALLADHGVPDAPVVPLGEVHAHPQVAATGAVTDVHHPVLGAMRQVTPAVRFDGVTVERLRPAPRLGEHTDEVLAELGEKEEART